MVLPRSESQNICVVTVEAVEPSLTWKGILTPGEGRSGSIWSSMPASTQRLVENVRGAAGDRVDPSAPEAADIDLRHGGRAKQRARFRRGGGGHHGLHRWRHRAGLASPRRREGDGGRRRDSPTRRKRFPNVDPPVIETSLVTGSKACINLGKSFSIASPVSSFGVLAASSGKRFPTTNKFTRLAHFGRQPGEKRQEREENMRTIEALEDVDLRLGGIRSRSGRPPPRRPPIW